MAATAPPLSEELRALLPAALQGRCTPLRCARGALLFRSGQRPSAMFFVDAGELTLQRSAADGAVVVLQRTRHGFVGEASLQAERYHCDAVAVADSTLTRLPRAELQAALQADPAFAARWIAMLNRELRRLRQQCERLSLLRVEARLLHLIETEGDATGLAIGAGLKSLAPELGVTHEALYRCVAALVRRGLLRRSPERLQLQRSRA